MRLHREGLGDIHRAQVLNGVPPNEYRIVHFPSIIERKLFVVDWLADANFHQHDWTSFRSTSTANLHVSDDAALKGALRQ